jgi:hypothetical protein
MALMFYSLMPGWQGIGGDMVNQRFVLQAEEVPLLKVEERYHICLEILNLNITISWPLHLRDLD